MDQRQKLLLNWLRQDLKKSVKELSRASADASFRRYFRVNIEGSTFIVMDAPPGKEDVKPFIHAARSLATLGVHTPEVHAYDLEQGFVLLEDLGNQLYLDELRAQPEALYTDAINALIKLQLGGSKDSEFTPPTYDSAKLVDEMSLFSKWFIAKHLGQTINEPSFAVWIHTQQLLVSACLSQPQVWVHRDYHSKNLMITNEESPGVIDFQDMVVGPIGYDLASIFKDCYIEWPREQQIKWLEQYRLQAIEQLSCPEFSLAQLTRWVDFAGLQRHLKVLGIFCRLNYRDGKAAYLDDLPLVAKYVLEVINIYPELSTFRDHFEHHIKAPLGNTT